MKKGLMDKIKRKKKDKNIINSIPDIDNMPAPSVENIPSPVEPEEKISEQMSENQPKIDNNPPNIPAAPEVPPEEQITLKDGVELGKEALKDGVGKAKEIFDKVTGKQKPTINNDIPDLVMSIDKEEDSETIEISDTTKPKEDASGSIETLDTKESVNMEQTSDLIVENVVSPVKKVNETSAPDPIPEPSPIEINQNSVTIENQNFTQEPETSSNMDGINQLSDLFSEGINKTKGLINKFTHKDDINEDINSNIPTVENSPITNADKSGDITNIFAEKTHEKEEGAPIKLKNRLNPSSPEAMFGTKSTSVKQNAIGGIVNPSSPEAIFRNKAKNKNTDVVDHFEEKRKFQNTNELIMVFIRSNYVFFASSNFNISAFLFGPLYFLYRKMYMYGLILFVIELLVESFSLISFSSIIGCLVIIILRGLYGILFNKLYLNYVKSNVLEMEKTVPEDQRKTQCKLRGGVSLSAPILLIIASLLVIGYIFSMFVNSDGTREATYAANIESSIEEYITNIDSYNIKVPTSHGSFACYRENKNDIWKLKDGYKLETGDCMLFMNNIGATTGLISFKNLNGGTVVISGNSLQTGTSFEINNFTCDFVSVGKFNCTRK